MKKLWLEAGLDELYLTMEYELDNYKRIDATLSGIGIDGRPKVLLIELKQWSSRNAEFQREIPRFVVKIGNDGRYSAEHPVEQVEDYAHYLRNHHEHMISHMLGCESCVVMLNYELEKKDNLFLNAFAKYDQAKLFCVETSTSHKDRDAFVSYLKSLFVNVDGWKAKKLFVEGNQLFSDADVETINKIIEDPENIDLLGEQYRINELVKDKLEKLVNGTLNQNQMIVISGAAGTGKTILGFRILSEAWKIMKEHGMDPRRKCAFAMPKSRTVFNVLSKICSESGGISPKYVDRLDGNQDVVVIDEAHRCTEFPKSLAKIKILVILQDDHQLVLGNERGTVKEFKKFAEMNAMHFIPALLKYQKRSSQYYVEHIDHLLYGEKIDPKVKMNDYSIVVCDSLMQLNDAIEEKHQETSSVKYYAPYCWAWKSKNVKSEMDIRIADETFTFQKQWNPINSQYEWYKNSIDRVGCVYTAQGLGFDYVGLIWWDDLKWNKEKNEWNVDIDMVTKNDQGSLARSLSIGENNDYLIKNIYRVLLTRAKKGIYIWFHDADTKEHFKSVILNN